MFKVFLDEMENHCNKRIKNLWLDHKGRYLSYKFRKHLKVEEENKEFPETPLEYGVFERWNQTLFDIVGSKVLSIKLPLYFKNKIFRDCRFTLKRAPSWSVEMNIRAMALDKTILVCKAYVKCLQPKSNKYVFLGYSKLTIGYSP
jgi:hypothetical protein